MIPLIFLLLGSFSSLHADAGASCALTEMQTTDQFAKSVLRTLNVSRLQNDPAEFCDQTMGVRFLSAGSTLLGPAMDAEKIQKSLVDGTWREKVEEKAAKENALSPWTASLIPTENYRTKALAAAVPGGNHDISPENSKVPLEQGLRKAIALLEKTPCEVDSAPAVISSDFDSDRAEDYKIKNQSLASKYACKEILGLLRMTSCDRSFETVGRISAPVKGITGMEVFRKVLLDGRYDDGLRRAASRVAKRVLDKSTRAADFFGDLKTSFRESGATDAESEEMAWNTVALIATSGPNTNWRLDQVLESGASQKKFSLDLLAASLPVLDHRSSREGHIYSFPPSVHGGCNTGKAYHFWYSAYLARRATAESGSAEASAVSAFQAEKAYQVLDRASGGFGSTSNGHEKSVAELMANSPLYSNASQVVRADLAYAAAGSVYGAKSAVGQKPALNTDEGIKTLLTQGGEGDAGVVGLAANAFGGKQLETYGKWTTKFDANSVFQKMNDGKYPGTPGKFALEFEKGARPLACPGK